MKENLENWKLHLNAISELKDDKLEDHLILGLRLVIKDRSWEKFLLIKKQSLYVAPQAYPEIINKLDLTTVDEIATANRLIHLFKISLTFYNTSIDSQKLISGSDYLTFEKRLHSMRTMHDLLLKLENQISENSAFLNYYSHFLEENRDLFKPLKEKVEEDGFLIPINAYITEFRHYQGFESDDHLDYYFSEGAEHGRLRHITDSLDMLKEVVDPIVFEKTHKNNFREFNLSTLKWYILKQFSYESSKKKMPWKFISTYFDNLLTIQELQANHPTDFNPKNLESKFRSSEK